MSGAAPQNTCSVWLQVGAHQTVVRVGSEPLDGASMVLAIGTRQLAEQVLRHTPPTPAEVEWAIQEVEDAVMRARALVPAHTVVCSADPGIAEIARLAGTPPGADLSLEAVEHTFNRWVALVEGRPSGQDVLPTAPGFGATLLILREFMHHLQTPGVRLI